MSDYLDVMLDMETMGNGPDAAIVSIGAVKFSVEMRRLGPEFSLNVSLADAVKFGGQIDAGTVIWWLEQSADARTDLLKHPAESIVSVLSRFSVWIPREHRRDVRIWGNGAAFDNVILRQAYRRADMPEPWRFVNDRCYRTVRAMHPDVPFERVGTHHNALDDAKSQALHLIDMLNPQPAGA